MLSVLLSWMHLSVFVHAQDADMAQYYCSNVVHNKRRVFVCGICFLLEVAQTEER